MCLQTIRHRSVYYKTLLTLFLTEGYQPLTDTFSRHSTPLAPDAFFQDQASGFKTKHRRRQTTVANSTNQLWSICVFHPTNYPAVHAHSFLLLWR